MLQANNFKIIWCLLTRSLQSGIWDNTSHFFLLLGLPARACIPRHFHMICMTLPHSLFYDTSYWISYWRRLDVECLTLPSGQARCCYWCRVGVGLGRLNVSCRVCCTRHGHVLVKEYSWHDMKWHEIWSGSCWNEFRPQRLSGDRTWRTVIELGQSYCNC